MYKRNTNVNIIMCKSASHCSTAAERALPRYRRLATPPRDVTHITWRANVSKYTTTKIHALICL